MSPQVERQYRAAVGRRPLDYSASSVMLGQTIKYEVGNVFDPAYTMVAKIPKHYLEPFRTK